MIAPQSIIQRINDRTGNGINQLEVKFVDSRVLLYGRTKSFYTLQLALAACMELLRSQSIRLESKIEVVGA